MKFTKWNNPNKKRHSRRIPKSQYIPTLAELNYCKQMNITPQEYVDIKYENEEDRR